MMLLKRLYTELWRFGWLWLTTLLASGIIGSQYHVHFGTEAPAALLWGVTYVARYFAKLHALEAEAERMKLHIQFAQAMSKMQHTDAKDGEQPKDDQPAPPVAGLGQYL